MAAPIIRNLFLFAFLFCCTVINATFTLGTEPKEPLGRLGIRLDWAFAKKTESNNIRDRPWMVSSHLTFKDPVYTVSRLTDGQLIQIAIDAYNEIDTEIRRYVTGNKDLGYSRPGAMNVLAFGNEIILASSYKGGADFTDMFPESEMSIVLERCAATFRRTGYQAEELDPHEPGAGNAHRTGGHCGEMTGFQLYSRRYPDEPLKQRSERPRSTTVSYVHGERRVRPIAPCHVPQDERTEDRSHGCDWIVNQQRVNYIFDGAGAPYRLENVEVGQLRICD